MNTQERREAIKETIKNSHTPISASALAKTFHVSRQVIVTDVAILRAAQERIMATPRGYLYEKESKSRYTIACTHDQNQTQDELETIVDLGGIVEDVIISHPVYGELSGKLHIASRLDVKEFIDLCKDKQAKNLSDLSDGVHFHTISCPSEREYELILDALKTKGYLYKQ